MLEASEDDLEYVAGRFQVKGTDQGKSLAEIAFAALQAHDWPDGIEPNLDSSAVLRPRRLLLSARHPPGGDRGRHRDRSGEAIRKYVAVDDIGKVVNPMIVEGQVHGGLTQGIAQALFEEAVYDENGTLTTGSFVDYLVPTAPDLIDFVTDRTESPALSNELGAKGVGEAGTIASTPAIVNGILDALRPLGVTDIEMPCTPMRVWKAIQGAEPMSEEAATPAEAQPHFDPQGDNPLTDSEGRCGMIPAAFDYQAPTSVDEALRLLAEGGDDAKIIAGGQSLLPVLKLRLAAPELVIDLAKIDALKGIRDDGDAIVIGAMTPHYQVVADPLVAEHASLLAKCVATVADPQVRHRGTLGGACAHADPASDIPAPTLALDAEFVIAGPGWATSGRGGGLLHRFLHDRGRRRRDPGRGPGAEVHRLGFGVREVRPGRSAVGHRRRGGDRPDRGRHHRRGADRVDQHGDDADPGAGGRAGARRGRGGGRGDRGGPERHRGRHRTADRPQRRPGVPPAPGVGAGPPCRAGGGGRLGRWT